MQNKQYTKAFNDSYLYNTADYTKEIYNFIMTAEVIDKTSDAFSDIAYQLRIRQTSPVLTKVLMSEKVVLCIVPKPMPRPFRVFRAVDVKHGKNADKKVFIDCSELIKNEGGVYKCKNLAVLMSYIISAMTFVLYYAIPDKLIRNSSLVQSGTEAFVDMMLYVLGYLKVPITYADNREKMSYALAVYYQKCILCKDNTDSISQLAKKVSKLDVRKCEYIDTIFNAFYKDRQYVNIKEFLVEFARVFLNQEPDSKDPNRFDIDTFVQRWMYAFGPGTYLGLELFPAFASILTDCYVGGYVNQQNTIEKIVGQNVVEFTTALLNIGSDNA